MMQVTVDFYKRIKISAIALMCAVACTDAMAAAVVQRGTASRRTAPRVSIASRMPTMAANITSSANANNTPTTDTPKTDADTTPSEPEKSDTENTTTDDVVITDKSAQFASAVNSAGITTTNNSPDTELAEQIRRTRAALDAADATNTANAAATKSMARGQNACDATLRACMKNKCGNDFTKCSVDTDTTWGTKMDACRRDTECTGNEYKLFASEIKADRDLNALLASYNKILDCGNQYNKCIINQCGNTYSKCLGKSAGDNAISNCASIANECKSADSGLASRTMSAFATLRQGAEVQIQSDEKRLYALRNQMATVCKRLGAMFDERSLDCVYTVNFWAGDGDVPYASKKAYAGATFDCDQDWFGIDITTFKENAYRLTRSQKSATAAMLGAGVGVATGAITSGAIGRAIDTQKAKNALKDAEREQAEINDKAASSPKSETSSDTKSDATSDKKNNTESIATSDNKADDTKTDVASTAGDRKLNRTLRKAERQASKDIDKEIANAEKADLAALATIENEKTDLSSDTLNVQPMENKSAATSDNKTTEAQTDTTRAVGDRKLNRTLRKAERQASKDIDKEIANAEKADLAALATIENEKPDLLSDTLNVQPMENKKEKYDSCVSDVNRKYVFSTESDPEYKAIYNRRNAAAEQECETELNTPLKYDIDGFCNSVSYTCKAGQTLRECEPQACWCLAQRSKISIRMAAREEFINNKIEQECGQYK